MSEIERRSTANQTNCAPEATVLGSGLRLPALSAAEYNGTLGHTLDYDDVHIAITGHATAVILPALLALAQQCR